MPTLNTGSTMFSGKKIKDPKPKRITVSEAFPSQGQNNTAVPDATRAQPYSLNVVYENVDASEFDDDTNAIYDITTANVSNRKASKLDKSDKSARSSFRVARKVAPVGGKNAGFSNSTYSSTGKGTDGQKNTESSKKNRTPRPSDRPPSQASSEISLVYSSHDSSNETSSTTDSIQGSRNVVRKQVASSDEAWLRSVKSRIITAAKGHNYLTRRQFKDALRVNESFFVDRFFQIMDKKNTGQVPCQILIDELRAITYGTQTEKIKFLFDIYNIKGSGKIQKSEVQQVLRNCIEESRIHVSAENLQALTDAVVVAADKDKDGKISFNELRSLVERYPTIAENMAIRTKEEERKSYRCCRHLTQHYIENNLKKVVFLIVYLIINLGLMAVAVWQYRNANIWIKIARANGLALNFNCTFVLILMLRVTLTRLRNTPLVQIFPFDQYIMFHKICGYMIVLQGILHTGAHVGNACEIANASLSAWEILLTTKAGLGWVANTAYLTGYVISVVLMVMIVLSLPFIRKSGNFEVFYWSHKLYIVFWIVLILHAGNFWKWFVVPGCIFLIETITRFKWVRNAYLGKTYIERVCLLPSEVTQLIISKPPNFTFLPGDYVFIQIPDIAKYEWHPFTISSAPEEKDSFWLHIRSAGYWTRSLHDYFLTYSSEDAEQGLSTPDLKFSKSKLRRRASSIAWLKSKSVKARKINANIMSRVVTKDVRVQVNVDGPYGTPTRHIFEAEHAVLIGSGIGVTPFASILQSIVYQYRAKQVTCPKCSYNWCHETPSTFMNLKKVDFVWINRDQRHFEWFTSLLSRLEREQEVEGGIGHILDMHMFMTSAFPKTDMKGLSLQLALDLVHQNEQTDLITGLQTRTQAGRPDFDELFTKIRDGSRGKIKVFFCGSTALGKVIKDFSHTYGFAFAHEYF